MADIPYWKFPHILIYACQMTDEEWADLLGLSESDATAWLEGDKERALEANDRLGILTSVIVALGHAYDGRGIADWLRRAAPALDNVRPLDHIAVGHRPEPVILAARQEAARYFGLTPDHPWWPEG
ncbi:MAG TPA: hypothetical protein VF763_04815 [Candidatus Limnocylindrales bacterium]